MTITELSTGKKYPINILPVEKRDFKTLKEDRFFFNWSLEQNYEVHKLQIVGLNNILGLVSMERMPKEKRVHIRLLTVSVENKGEEKLFDHIAGNLLTHAAKIAVMEYGELACISLRPKSSIATHYINKYKMSLTGVTLSLEVPEILNLIDKYDHD